VPRQHQQALPKGALPAAPTLLDCFLEALKKRDGRDYRPQVPAGSAADQGPTAPEPATGAAARFIPE